MIEALVSVAMNSAFKGAIEQSTPLLSQATAIADESLLPLHPSRGTSILVFSKHSEAESPLL